MTEEWLAPGIWKVSDGTVALFVGHCECGCYWKLWPNYRTLCFEAQHGDNPEAVLAFPKGAGLDAPSMMATLNDWLDRCHAYEGAVS